MQKYDILLRRDKFKVSRYAWCIGIVRRCMKICNGHRMAFFGRIFRYQGDGVLRPFSFSFFFFLVFWLFIFWFLIVFNCC